ncbi:MAG: CHAT domain-containing protein, partial [Sphingomonadales bacterium]
MDAGEANAIGRALFDPLDETGWASRWLGAPKHRQLVVRTQTVSPSNDELALLNAPWELLAAPAGPLVADAGQLFIVQRQLGPIGQQAEPQHGDLRLMFMAASPEGQTELDIDQEEAAIASSAGEVRRLALVVEETGTLPWLEERLRSEGPFEALHISCHGDVGHQGPLLAFEDAAQGMQLISPDELIPAAEGVSLLFLSACRTAEHTAHLAFAHQAARTIANVLGWDGSVLDADATLFARHFYGQLVKGQTAPMAAARARQHLWKANSENDQQGRHWHLARVYSGPGGGGPLCAPNKPQRQPPPEPAAFLDNNRTVRVAPPRHFVGRRRQAQAAIRALRQPGGMVLLHGMGAVGKSSLAARLITRTALAPVVVYGRFDHLSLFDAL